jgi:hypothetical protein
MIRQLYELEDWLFYRSRTCDPFAARLIESLSLRIGEWADKLQTGRESLG